VRISTEEEDRRLIDAVVETDVGQFFVQIKSSHKGAERFYERLKKVIQDENERFRYICRIIRKDSSLKRIRQRTFAAIREKREKLLRKQN